MSIEELTKRAKIAKENGQEWVALLDVLKSMKSDIDLSRSELDKLNQAIAEIEKMEGPRGEKGEKGDSIIGPPGIDGRDGKSIVGPKGDRGESGKSIVGPTGSPGISIKGERGERGPEGSADTGGDIKKKLETLQGDSRLSAKAIKDLPTITRELPQLSIFGSRGGGTHLTVTAAGVSMGQDIHRINFTGVTGYRAGDGSTTIAIDPSQSGYTVENQTGATLNETATEGLVVILADATANNITINLPTAVGNTAQITVKKTDSSANTVTIDAAGTEKIDDGLTAVLRNQYESVTLVTDQLAWYIV